MKLTNKLIGSIVELQFWDHCTNAQDTDLVKCTVIGRISSITRLSVQLRYWESSANPEDNNEHMVILKSAITNVAVIRRKST